MRSAPHPPSIQALLDRADEFARAGDPKAAMSFYQAALKGAKAGYAELGTMERLRGAQAFVQRRADEFQQSLDRAVADFRPTDTAAQTRLTHALEMLKGERSIYPQQPAVFYYPYLAQRQFFEREEFDWVPQIEAATPVIREELLALLDAGADFRPYVEDHPNRPRREFHHLNNDPSWTALYLWRDGKLVPEVADRCPRTVEALAKTPLSHIGHRTPAALFSRLEPGAHIPPHSGMLNCRLICHLPLIVPKGCWLRVGNEAREWKEGELLIFDDSIEHEAKNPSGELRIVLLFDIWRPELTDTERQAISAIFNAIDNFQALPDA
ncbi:MAG TPA: aspartyl/asparaginyl beta-hydroxylase domain-containing protein [Sphingomicrobium sp.]|nr:aspartyl/asparaginyl beta-hydroxylase domain-containing protein [Sphingomicrobium sp.]